MATHGHSLETKASPDAVWRLWSAPETWPDWNPDVTAIHVDGPFAAGSSGSMTTRRGGTHAIRLEEVQAGKAFELATKAMPGTTFHFRCEIAPLGSGGSRISQSIRMTGGLAPIFSGMMGPKIAQSFEPILRGLAAKAEAAG